MGYDETNRGAIWKNEKKETEKQPDFTGSLDVEGVGYWVSAWKRKPGGKENSPALSFSIKLKEARKAPTHNQAVEPEVDFSDDIPF